MTSTTCEPRQAALGAPLSADANAQAGQLVERLRWACEATPGQGEVLNALHLCLLHDLPIPPWLRDQFNRRFLRVSSAEVASFDAAFGRYWRPYTNLAAEKVRARSMRAVHAAVFELALAPLPNGAWRPIDRGMFEEIGARNEIAASGSKAERLYYAALKAGLVNVARLRRDMVRAS